MLADRRKPGEVPDWLDLAAFHLGGATKIKSASRLKSAGRIEYPISCLLAIGPSKVDLPFDDVDTSPPPVLRIRFNHTLCCDEVGCSDQTDAEFPVMARAGHKKRP